MNKFLFRRLKIISRSPFFFFNKVRAKFCGIESSWLQNSRDAFKIGSWQWLALSERLYGGFKCGTASGKCIGGDRMSPFFHGYGKTYEKYLKHFILSRMDKFTLLEVGILNGTGLAIWCDLFPNARVIGLDLDLSNFEKNRSFLEGVGAFSMNKPELFEFNQLDLLRAQDVLKQVLGNTVVDIAIDDGCHSIESIEVTLAAMLPHLAKKFVYFIEDNFDTYDVLAHKHLKFKWQQRGEIVVFTNKPFR
jgi:hypothetical protein